MKELLRSMFRAMLFAAQAGCVCGGGCMRAGLPQQAHSHDRAAAPGGGLDILGRMIANGITSS